MCFESARGDAAAIARDAIESAKAKNIDVVLVDTAGRMQNKTNLMKELEKVRRVANPHLVLFVGDALAGNDAVDQAKMFQEMMRFDGAVLSKMDTDAKGGAGLSIAFATGRPIVFAGVGQGTTISSSSILIGCWMRCFHEGESCLKTKKLRRFLPSFTCFNALLWPISDSWNILLVGFNSISRRPRTSSIFFGCCKTKPKGISMHLQMRC